jgi:hypothetical protein
MYKYYGPVSIQSCSATSWNCPCERIVNNLVIGLIEKGRNREKQGYGHDRPQSKLVDEIL